MTGSDTSIWVLGSFADQALHQVSWDGQILRSLHEVPKEFPYSVSAEWQPVLSETAATGYIECLPDINAVAFVSEWLPDVYMHGLDRQLVSHAALPAYVTAEPVETESGGCTGVVTNGRPIRSSG